MNNDNYNNDFFGYTGFINRKNYIINMLILISIGVICKFINVEALFTYSSFKFLIHVLDFAVSMIIFVVSVACLSLVFRRLADITSESSENAKNSVKKLFSILYVFPFIYLLCIRYFIGDIPFISSVLDLSMLFFFLPSALLVSLIIAIYKGSSSS